jgi:hypothetical protein
MHILRDLGAIIGKKTQCCARLFYLFARLHLLSSDSFSSLIFFLLLFSSLALPSSAFHLSILSEVWLLNFLRLRFMATSPKWSDNHHVLSFLCDLGTVLWRMKTWAIMHPHRSVSSFWVAEDLWRTPVLKSNKNVERGPWRFGLKFTQGEALMLEDALAKTVVAY